jgi:hypothetical protein
MESSSLCKAAAVLVLALVAAACEGDNLFPEFGVGNGVPGQGAIEGSVTTAGTPMGGVWIILVDRDSTQTDGLGEYRFAPLPASTYTVSIRVPLNHTLAPGDSATQRVTVAAGGVRVVDWRLIAEGPVP